MRNLIIGSLLAASALLQTGCAVTEGISSACRGSFLEAGCDLVFGYKDRQQDSRIDDNEDLLFAIAAEISAEIKKNDEELQLEINAMQAQLTYYATLKKGISLIDPCDDYPGHYDEVLIRLDEGETESGRLVAFFEDGGGRRFLTILQPNTTYQTTDKQKCTFRINQFNQIEYPITKY